MRFPNLLPILALLPVACGGGASSDDGGVVSISLDSQERDASSSSGDPSMEGTTNDPSGQDLRNVDEAESQQDSAETQVAPASLTDSAAALRSLDNWHRSLADSRSFALNPSSAQLDQISSFARVFAGQASAYRSSLQGATSSVFGPDFHRFSQAWSDGGTKALQKELAAGPAGTAQLVWTDALAELSLRSDDYQTAGKATATMISDMLAAGYMRERVLELRERVDLIGRHANTFLPSTEYQVAAGDSYWVICRHFRDQKVIAPQGWIAEFNHKRSYNLRAGEKLQIPTATLSLRAWREARILALYADGVPIRLYAVSMGQAGKPTPLGVFTFSNELLKEPIYYPPGAPSVPYGNPENPLGERWMGFSEDRQYGIHGTNSEETIGSFESGGCIRMHNADATELFELVASGLKVTIQA